jgi:hypothetical protein
LSLGVRHLTDTLGVMCRELRKLAQLTGASEEDAVRALVEGWAPVANAIVDKP